MDTHERMKMMNLSKTVFLSGLAIAALAVPAANADPRGGGRPQMSSASRAAMATRLGATPQSAPRRPDSFRNVDAGRRWSGGDRNWRNGDGRRGDRDGRRWGNGDGRWRGHHGHWRHRRHYPRYYYSSFYPYGFGYPYGGYGYPYYGASAQLYYYGTPRSRYAYEGQGGGGNLVVSVQQQLAEAGYYRGGIDGVIGDGTRRAIRAYERANGLPVDGRIDENLLEQMGLR
jgi:hypothetical protein